MRDPEGNKKAPRGGETLQGAKENNLVAGREAQSQRAVNALRALGAAYALTTWPAWVGHVWVRSKLRGSPRLGGRP